MSAAEPVDAVMPNTGGDTGGAADIINITTRARATRRTDPGRRKPMSSPPPDTPPGSAQQQLAEHLEVTFNGHRLSLTDESTKNAFIITLQAVRRMLQGAEAEGIVDGGQRLELDAMIEGMEVVPQLVERSG